MPTLREIVTAQVATASELPLVHTNQRSKLAEFRATHLLQEPECEIFHEPIVYLFYGRPAFRHKDAANPGACQDLQPIAFVFKPHTLSNNIRRMYACDSGAVHYGRLEPHIAPADLPELALEPQIDSARKIVPLIFGNNGHYYATRALDLAAGAFTAGSVSERWHNAIRNPHLLPNCDDRMSSVEIQVLGPVDLRNNLLYVVLPGELLNETVLDTVHHQWNCDVFAYHTYGAVRLQEYYSDLRAEVRRQYEATHRIERVL